MGASPVSWSDAFQEHQSLLEPDVFPQRRQQWKSEIYSPAKAIKKGFWEQWFDPERMMMKCPGVSSPACNRGLRSLCIPRFLSPSCTRSVLQGQVHAEPFPSRMKVPLQFIHPMWVPRLGTAFLGLDAQAVAVHRERAAGMG